MYGWLRLWVQLVDATHYDLIRGGGAMSLTKEHAHQLSDAITGFVERKLAPVETDIRQLKAREQTHFETIESLIRRIEALERKPGQKSGAVKLIKADNR